MYCLRFPRSFSRFALVGGQSLVFLLLTCLGEAQGAPAPANGNGRAWQNLSAEAGRRVDVDRSSIRKDETGKTQAWGRLILDKEIPDTRSNENYRGIEALNRYDCENRSFVTLKRVFLKANGEVLREEENKALLEMPVRGGSVEDRLLRLVCRPQGEAQQVAAAQNTARKVEDYTLDLRKANEDLIRREVDKANRASRAAVPTPAPVARDVRRTSAESAAKPAVAPEKPPERPSERPAEPAAPKYKVIAPGVISPLSAAGHASRPVASTRAPVESGAARRLAEARTASANSHVHWSYEGEEGPEHWGELRQDYALCASGTRQSPIDIRDGIRVDLAPLEFNYQPSYFRVLDNGHTIQTAVGGSSLTLQGKTYDLVQFHFHRPSEEKINGRAYDMVVHLVHKSPDDDKLAVVAVMLERGKDHPLIQTLWNNLPLERNDEVAPPNLTIDPATLLPDDKRYYTYMGSLTTPPCSEGVLWLVMKQPVQLSAEQIGIFARLYRNNARPLQNSNGRLIKESR